MGLLKNLFKRPEKLAYAPVTKTLPCKCEHHNVTGVSHYVNNIMSLPLDNYEYSYTKKELIDNGLIGEPVYKYNYSITRGELREEPGNKYDSNAIMVLFGDVHVGYIKKGSCSHIKNLLSTDVIKNVCGTIRGGDYKIITEFEDDDAKDGYSYELEKCKNSNFYIDLDVYIKSE